MGSQRDRSDQEGYYWHFHQVDLAARIAGLNDQEAHCRALHGVVAGRLERDDRAGAFALLWMAPRSSARAALAVLSCPPPRPGHRPVVHFADRLGSAALELYSAARRASLSHAVAGPVRRFDVSPATSWRCSARSSW